MAFVIPDKMMNNLICDICHKYLSVPPVKIYPKRITKCGRCVETSETDGEGTLSLIGIILNKSLFKCINRFDGCRELLTYSQVRDHENICISKVYKCPFTFMCPEEDISSHQLERHFLDKHKESVLKMPVFDVHLGDHLEDQIFYYQLEDLQFLIALKYSHQEDIMCLNIRLVGTPEQADNINQQFWISSDHIDFSITTGKRPCTCFDAENSWFQIGTLDMSNKLIIVKFELEVAGLHCLTIPSTVFKTIANPQIPFKPMNRSPFVPRKIHLDSDVFDKDSDVFDKYPDISLSPCGTAIIHLNRLIFLQCLNCHEICWTGANEEFDKFYICKTSQHTLCYFCFKYLLSQKDIREDDYSRTTLPWDVMEEIQFFCKSECEEHLLEGSSEQLQGPCGFAKNVLCPMIPCGLTLDPSKLEDHCKQRHTKQIHVSYGSHYFLLQNKGEIIYVKNPPMLLEFDDDGGHYNNYSDVYAFHIRSAGITHLLFDKNGEFLKIFDNMNVTDNRNCMLKIISNED